jgi:hypothetical protein
VTFWILEKKEPDTDSSMKLVQKLSNLDPLNMIPLSASLVILFVGLEMGGISLSWSNPRVWGCLVVSALLGLAFGYFQYRKGDK